eukprot:TRINITY_DN64358_c6_g1_i1.p1 TRINITY_DN64358_c6_g1~~TRINITY_DN64358_c6_g1_i1.p1  ORF type:complete len:777 (-),score=149.79 TRINITY_DN64358_c6_g1_i1:12541-14871(-)
MQQRQSTSTNFFLFLQSKCVIKEVDLSKMTEQERNETRQEAKILSVLKHPSIVNFREVFTTVSNKLCIVMDFADGGDLQKRIKENRGKFFSESQILDWFTQICLGLKHVHDRKILHRDIKAQNVFLTSTNRCLLGDFGIAKILSNTKGFARTMVGTPYYLSPEILESKHYSFQSDIWSLGVLLYELCALKPPFDAPSLHFLAMKIVRGNYPPISSHYSRDLKNLVVQMLMVDPSKRPTIHQILKMNIIQTRIKTFLNETEYSSEFSHTVLHKVNVLDNKENKLAAAHLPSKAPLAKPGPLPSARNSPFARQPQPAPSPIFVAHANKDRELERMRLERERLFRLKEKEIADKKRAEELEKKKQEEAERKRIEELEKKRLEELDKKRIEEEKKKQERKEEILKLMPPKMPQVARTPRVQVEDPLALNRPKLNAGIIAASPIAQPVVKKNDRINQIKANFDRQIGILKGEKRKLEAQSASKGSFKKSKDSKINQSAEKDKETEEKRKQKVKEREEQRKKMRDDIKEQRKKISPVKQDSEVQWLYGQPSARKESPQVTPTGSDVPAKNIPEVPSQQLPKDPPLPEEETKKKHKKSGKTKLKSKKKKSLKKNAEVDPSENEEQKQKPPIVPLTEIAEVNDEVAKAQKEINNYMWMRKEMEKLVGDGKTPNPDEFVEECDSLAKIAQENNEKDQDRDDVTGELEEEKEEIKEQTPMGDFATPKPKDVEIPPEEEKAVDDKSVVKDYLEGKFGKEKVQKIASEINKAVLNTLITEMYRTRFQI